MNSRMFGPLGAILLLCSGCAAQGNRVRQGNQVPQGNRVHQGNQAQWGKFLAGNWTTQLSTTRTDVSDSLKSNRALSPLRFALAPWFASELNGAELTVELTADGRYTAHARTNSRVVKLEGDEGRWRVVRQHDDHVCLEVSKRDGSRELIWLYFTDRNHAVTESGWKDSPVKPTGFTRQRGEAAGGHAAGR